MRRFHLIREWGPLDGKMCTIAFGGIRWNDEAEWKGRLAKIAPSGGAFVKRVGLPWTGDYVLAALRGESLHRLRLSNGRTVVDEELLRGEFGRLRTVREGPDGCLYVLTSNRDGRGTPRPGDDRVLCVRLPGS